MLSISNTSKKSVPDKLFTSKYQANVDWYAWEVLSKKSGYFIYINRKLMGHRISEETETSKIINKGKRSAEDLEIYRKFWPKFVAKLLTKVYKNSEKSNKI